VLNLELLRILLPGAWIIRSPLPFRHFLLLKWRDEPSLLLLIPAYNEERRIEPVLRDFGRYSERIIRASSNWSCAQRLPGQYFGSGAERIAEFPFISALDFPDPIGKGGALIEGLKLAPGAELIGYVDADGASPPKAFTSS